MVNLTSKANSISTAFYLYAQRVESVSIQKDSATLQMSDKAHNIPATRSMIQRIANASSIGDIEKVLKDFGPPDVDGIPVLGGIDHEVKPRIVHYSMLRWRMYREVIRSFWMGAEGRTHGMPADHLAALGETLRFNDKTGQLEYYAKNLANLLHLFMLSQPASNFKRCRNPECTKPFICDHDAKRKLCGSIACERWNYAEHQRKFRRRS